MHQPATHPAVLAPTPFASPYAVGHQPDVLHRVVEVFRNAARRGGPAIVLTDGPSDCRFHIEAPGPDAALVAYAASLGINESDGVRWLFVNILCYIVATLKKICAARADPPASQC